MNGETEWRIFKCNNFEELLHGLLGAAEGEAGDNSTFQFALEVNRQVLVGVSGMGRQISGITQNISFEGARLDNGDLCMSFQNRFEVRRTIWLSTLMFHAGSIS